MNFTCGSCDNTWSGLSMAHCATCHETFGSVDSFDKHRNNGKCLEPSLGGKLHFNETRRCWSRTAPEDIRP